MTKGQSSLAGRRPRLFVEAALAKAGRIEANDAQAHYLRHVLRLSPGDGVILFNGKDGEFSSQLEFAGKKGAILEIGDRLRDQMGGADLWLVFAPLKRARLELMVEKATELGVAALCPVVTQYTDHARLRLDRLSAITIEASEQCERLTLPDLHEPQKLDALLADWPPSRRILLCDESAAAGRGGAPAFLDAVADLSPGPPSGGSWALLVGPEGGFAPRELDALRKLPFVTAVGLGPRVLRAETAAIAALACWQAALGDWREQV